LRTISSDPLFQFINKTFYKTKNKFIIKIGLKPRSLGKNWNSDPYSKCLKLTIPVMLSFHFILFHFVSFHFRFISFHFSPFHLFSFVSFHFFRFISFGFDSCHFISFRFVFRFISFHLELKLVFYPILSGYIRVHSRRRRRWEYGYF